MSMSSIYHATRGLRRLSAPWQLVAVSILGVVNTFCGYFMDWWPVKETNMIASFLAIFALNLDWLDASEQDQPNENK